MAETLDRWALVAHRPSSALEPNDLGCGPAVVGDGHDPVGWLPGNEESGLVRHRDLGLPSSVGASPVDEQGCGWFERAGPAYPDMADAAPGLARAAVMQWPDPLS